MRRQSVLIVFLTIFGLFLGTLVPCQADQEPWVCPNDDEANGIYWICNYFPLNPNNQWQYTTGEYHVVNDVHTCSSGYSGILYATTTYEYSSYMQNGQDGLLFSGCQYDGDIFEDWGGIYFMLIPPSVSVGETVRILTDQRGTVDVSLVGLETITVPAGTFATLKVQWARQGNAGSCSYKTTAWLAKGIGPVKIHRTDASPADCLGCFFVCDPNNNVIKLNTPAELMSFDLNQGTDQHTITVTKIGTGSGTIAGSGLVYNGNVCTGTYASGTAVTLTAQADTGSTFDGWAGGGCSGKGTCVTTLNTDTTITAAFTLTQGTQGKPIISVSPMSVNCGSVPVGGTSNPKTVAIKNTGNDDLIINSITISGANQSEFIQTNSCSIVAAKSSCPVTLTFNPSLPFGKKSAIMSISSNDPKKPIINVKLSGQAPPPKISVSPKSVNFGSVEVGNTSSPKIVTIKNTGTSDLKISSITITGTNAAEFGQTNDCSIVAKGGSCSATVTFSPTSAGSKSALMSVSSNDPKKTLINVKLSGKGTHGTSVTAYNAPQVGSAAIQATNLVSITEVFSQLGNVESESISSERPSEQPLKSLMKKVMTLAMTNRARADVSAMGSGHETLSCPDGGSISMSASWTGPDEPEDLAEISDFKATITFHSCEEETVTWNGTVKMALEGPFTSPTKFSLSFTNLVYIDSLTADNITMKNFSIVIADIGYQYDEIKSAKMTFNGAITGEVTGKPINQAYKDFGIALSSSSGGQSLTMSGSMSPSCFGGWLTVTTNVPVFIPNGAQCPTAGEIVSRAGGNSAKVVIKPDSQIEVYFNDTLVNTFYDCKEVESLCVA